jgi:tetratricopeptide (TPR) repeat protein
MAVKLSKHELKEPDKFQVVLARTLAYLTANKTKVSVAVAVFTAGLLIAAGWYLYDLNMEKNAQQIYARTYQLKAGDNTAAAGIYKEVLEKYPRSRAAILASYRLGGLYYRLGDFETAIRHYEVFLRKAPDKSDIRTIAYMGLGSCHEAKGDFKNALAAFEKAMDGIGGQVFGSMNHQNIARVYEAMNDRAKALEYYQKALTSNTDPISELLLKRKIATLS